MNALLDYFEPFGRTFVQSSMNGICLGVAVTLIVWCLLRSIRHINAATRFAIWWAALIAVALLPFLNNRLAYPQVSELAGEYQSIKNTPIQSQATSHSQLVTSPPTIETGSAESMMTSLPSAKVGDDQNIRRMMTVRFASGPWTAILFFLWLLVSLILLGRLARSYFCLRQLKRDALPLPQNRQESLRSRSIEGQKRRVRFGSSKRIVTPLAAGFARPMILIPESMLDELTEEEFGQIVLHELAHIRRFDDWTDLAQRLIEVVLFFNPAVWFIGRQLRLEREIACDDSVVSVTGKSKPYAACLLRLADLTGMHRISMIAPGAVLTRSQLSMRIETLMNTRRNATVRLSRVMILTVIGLMAITVGKGPQILPSFVLDTITLPALAHVDQATSLKSKYDEISAAEYFAAHESSPPVEDPQQFLKERHDRKDLVQSPQPIQSPQAVQAPQPIQASQPDQSRQSAQSPQPGSIASVD